MLTVWGERLAAILCSLGAVYMMYLAWEFPANGDQFPLFAGTAIIFTSALMIIRSVVSPNVFTGDFQYSIRFGDVQPLLLTAATVGYVLLIFELGYYTSSLLFLVIISLLVGVRNLKAIALTVFITFPLMYAFFELFLQAQMPRGIFV
ncbi:MAG: tripartite tricarboxylate transporter TctB family protein [Hyphomicrobiaceae bacterium]